MRLLALLLFSLPAQADYWFAEIGLGNNTNLGGCSICWNDGGGMGTIAAVGYVWEKPDNIFIKAQVLHNSQWNSWGSTDESSVDFIGISLQKRWY